MATPLKTFDEAKLLSILREVDDEAEAGRFTVIRPSATLFGEVQHTIHQVQAITEAYWCERYKLALIVQRTRVLESGHLALPHDHPLRAAHQESKTQPRVHMRYGGTSSQLVRWAAAKADEYREDVASLIPTAPIDLAGGALVEIGPASPFRLDIIGIHFAVPADSPQDESDGSTNDPLDALIEQGQEEPDQQAVEPDPDRDPGSETIDDLLSGFGDQEE